jgi:hypothetical protein
MQRIKKNIRQLVVIWKQRGITFGPARVHTTLHAKEDRLGHGDSKSSHHNCKTISNHHTITHARRFLPQPASRFSEGEFSGSPCLFLERILVPHTIYFPNLVKFRLLSANWIYSPSFSRFVWCSVLLLSPDPPPRPSLLLDRFSHRAISWWICGLRFCDFWIWNLF